jgi:oligopeptidase B
VEYSISHFEDHFYIITNKDDAFNYKLLRTELKNTSSENWIEVIGHRGKRINRGIDIFKDFLVVSERFNGLNRINIKPWNGSESYYLKFESETF